jgi:HSP20 family protein
MLPSLWRKRGYLSGPTTDDFIERFFYGWPTFDRNSEVAWAPRVDVNDTEKEIIVDVELPGIDKKDVKVEVKDNTLVISGERKSEKKTEETNCCVSERHYGKFERSFALSDEITTDKIAAQYKNGVLTLTLPKTEKVLPKEITVEVK